ncbi:MAG: stimulus-sensing domain-containing protein [Alphaproteobacteria bacterium]|nr:stimulus-sensing domain-containing protein [Alphaproteobacteria bacterium]
MFSRLSPLTARILAVNAMPLILLVVSILYFDGYQNRLVQNELDSMTKEARQFAAALGEGAVISSEDERDLLSPELAQSMLRRLMETTETRTRLYDIRGTLFSDSQHMPGHNHMVQSEILPPPGTSTNHHLSEYLENAIAWFRLNSWSKKYAAYKEETDPSSEDYMIVEHALDGDEDGEVWLMPNGHILLGVAVPVQRYKGVLGAVFLSRAGVKIEQAVMGVRIDIVRLFSLTLVLTILLSLYLARAIAKPLQQLSSAAEVLKSGQSTQMGALKLQSTLPDFSSRDDEIGDLSIALRAMVKALGERLHATENFAADVAHEIKNPLTSLHSAVETALKIKDPERQQKLMLVIADDVQRLDRLITDISQASRIEAELSRAKTKPIALERMLEMVVALYEPIDDTPKPKVVFETGKDIHATIHGAETRLVQVFQNLIGNALSFSPVNGTVHVGLTTERGMARITVADDGPGMPENKLEAVFERFYSERPEHEAFGKHSGLGLSIAKQIVEAHQGTITAQNIKDENSTVKGALFIVELPLSKAE